jgi:hypothetical protein
MRTETDLSMQPNQAPFEYIALLLIADSTWCTCTYITRLVDFKKQKVGYI